MSEELFAEFIIDMLFVFGFIGLICLLDFVAEHLIPEHIMDRILEKVFGVSPDDIE